MIWPSAVSNWAWMVPRGVGAGAPSLARPNRAGDAGPGSQRLINHNCFNSVNDVFRNGRSAAPEPRRQAYEFAEVFPIVMSGPATGRCRRAGALRALLPCLALIALDAPS